MSSACCSTCGAVCASTAATCALCGSIVAITAANSRQGDPLPERVSRRTAGIAIGVVVAGVALMILASFFVHS